MTIWLNSRVHREKERVSQPSPGGSRALPRNYGGRFKRRKASLVGVSNIRVGPCGQQNNGLARFLARSLTISLYASLLSLGVSLMVPMKTKKRPRAKERATMVTVLGEAIFGLRERGFPRN